MQIAPSCLIQAFSWVVPPQAAGRLQQLGWAQAPCSEIDSSTTHSGITPTICSINGGRGLILLTYPCRQMIILSGHPAGNQPLDLARPPIPRPSQLPLRREPIG